MDLSPMQQADTQTIPAAREAILFTPEQTLLADLMLAMIVQ